MVKKIRHPESNQDLIQALLQQRASEQALTRRWNLYSLLIIWVVLAAIIIMRLSDINLYIVGGVAFVGLSGLWFYTYRQGKKLEKQFFNQETRYLQSRLPDKANANVLSSPLSARELEVLTLIVKGNTNKEIAKQMQITEQTTKNHITHILKKLNVTDRTSAAVLALHSGWIKTDPSTQPNPQPQTPNS